MDLRRCTLRRCASGTQRRETRPPGRFGFDRIERADGSPLDAVCALAARVAVHDLSVLLLGESGTGKELLARAIHYASPRAGGAFVVENCAALPDTLLESELFGHKRGAFTGAYRRPCGPVPARHGGTIFLDEIGETSPRSRSSCCACCRKAKCARWVRRPVPVDVRVIAATHRDLEDEVRAGRFREDLYYRLAGVTLQCRRCASAGRRGIRSRSRLLAGQRAASSGWPSKRSTPRSCELPVRLPAGRATCASCATRSLRAVALADGRRLSAAHLSPRVLHAAGAAAGGAPRWPALGGRRALRSRLDAVEAKLVCASLIRHRWNKTRTRRRTRPVARGPARQAACASGWSAPAAPRMGPEDGAEDANEAVEGALAMNLLWLQAAAAAAAHVAAVPTTPATSTARCRRPASSLLWHPTLSLDSGAEVLELLDELLAGRRRLDIAVVEGALLRGPQGSGRFQLLAGTGQPMIELGATAGGSARATWWRWAVARPMAA
jgi:hypothetical protein